MGTDKIIKPVTALYVAALPIFDMTFTVLRRILRQKSPFKSDRSHIHHLMQDLGLSDFRTLVIIVCIGSILPSIGILLDRLGTSEALQLAFFLMSFMVYCLLMSLAWMVAKEFRSR